MKKLFSLLLIPIILLTVCKDISAETVYTEDTLKYVIRNNEVVIVKYFGTEEEVTVPRMINNIPVTTISSGAFVDTFAKKVILPDSVVYIEAGAFSSNTKYINENDIVEDPENPDNPQEEHNIVDNNEGAIENIPTYEVDDIGENGEVDENGNVVTNNNVNNSEINEVHETDNPVVIEKTYSPTPILYIVLVVAIIAFVFIKKKLKK